MAPQQVRSLDSFHSLATARLAGADYWIHRIDAVDGASALPLTHRILLENLLRHEDGAIITAGQIEQLVGSGTRAGETAIAFFPSRVFLHDTNGVPVLTDLAALRDASAEAGGDPARVTPLIPSELIVDHSVAAEVAGRADAYQRNVEVEYARNAERYRFLKWGEQLPGLRVVPPGRGIMHQINAEYLARVVERRDGFAFPDTCAGTDSHTTMVNGLGVLAWGVGGIEAEIALLGQPLTLTVPPVVGVELVGALEPGVTATDLVLTITQRLREHGVVGAFIEFTGPAVPDMPLAHRLTVSNMCPEYGATAALFPIDRVTLDYLRLTGRNQEHVGVIEAYAKEQGLWFDLGVVPRYDDTFRIDLSRVETSLAGPRRPQDRVALRAMRANALGAIREATERRCPSGEIRDQASPAAGTEIADGAVAIAAITSCTNTSNPHAIVGAALLARSAVERGLRSKPWVKTSFAPGSKTVTGYLHAAGLTRYLDTLGFQLVGYGCTTCIGNSGPLLPSMAKAVADKGVIAASVVSGNRNFDGRINNDVSLTYLASPSLVIAYAIAGSVTHDLADTQLGVDADGQSVMLRDIWPTDDEIESVIAGNLTPQLFRDAYAAVFDEDDRWTSVPSSRGAQFEWGADSTYLRRPPFLTGITKELPPTHDVIGARALLVLGDSVTTDHISPAGRIPRHSSAGRYLAELGEQELNTYASRRGNHEVMVRGGFANPRLRNRLVRGQGREAVTRDFLRAGAIVPVYDAAQSYRQAGVPLIVIAGAEYGTGSSRDWAAKATSLLGVRAVLARSFEHIHRANLVQLGVLPLQFLPGDSADALGLDGSERFAILDIDEALDAIGSTVTIAARRDNPALPLIFRAIVRIDTPQEAVYFRNGGVLPFVFRMFLRGELG